MSQQFLVRCCLLGLILAGTAGLQAADSVDVAELLHQWQQASQGRPTPSVETDLAAYAESHSAHELEAAAALCGPVAARELAQQFDWTLTANDDESAILTAAPRDALNRLFFSAVEIELDATSHLPRRLRFRDAQNELRPLAITTPISVDADGMAEESGGIRLASLVEFADAEEDTDAPQIAEILRAWKAATSRLERAEIEFVRYEYEHVLGVEKRGQGRFHFEHPDQGVYELQTVEIEADATSRRSQANGAPFKVESDPASIVLWESQRVVFAYPDKQAYDELAAPRAKSIQPAGSFTRAWYSLATPQSLLPATVDVHSADFLDRFDWALLDHDDERLILQGRPVTDEDQLEIFELQVILDPATHLAQATRMIPADRNREVVYVIKQFTVNDDVAKRDWRPNLSGYQKYNAAPLAPPAEEE